MTVRSWQRGQSKRRESQAQGASVYRTHSLYTSPFDRNGQGISFFRGKFHHWGGWIVFKRHRKHLFCYFTELRQSSEKTPFFLCCKGNFFRINKVYVCLFENMLVQLLGFFPLFPQDLASFNRWGWIGRREWPGVHFFFISSYAYHSLYDLYLTYHTSSKLCTELWINICFLSLILILQPCNLWLSQKAGRLSCLLLHLPYEKKHHFFDDHSMLGEPETTKLSRIHKRKRCWGQNCKKWTRNIFLILWNVKNVFIASLKCFWCFLKVNPGDGWGRDFDSERGGEKIRNNQSFMTNPTLDTEGTSLTPYIFQAFK